MDSSASKQNFLAVAIANLRTRPRGNVPSLDILRTIAILLVLSVHAGNHFYCFLAALPFVYGGWTGVDLFFILSGYLIGGQLWKELMATGTVQVGRFILRRGFRIWPLYYSVLLFTFIMALVRSQGLHSFGTDLFFLSNYVGHTNVGGSWSLSTEEQFYIAFPLILWAGSRLVPYKRLAWVPIAWLIALPVIRAVLFHRHGAVDGSPIHTHSDGLAIGLLIAWLAVFYPERMKTPFWKNALMLVSVVVVALCLRGKTIRPVFEYSSLALLFGSCALFLLRLANPPAWFGWPVFYVISRLSYGIYLNHFFVLEYMRMPIQNRFGSGTAGFLACWFIALFVSGAIAFITFAAIELPFLRLRESYVSKRVQTPVPAKSLA